MRWSDIINLLNETTLFEMAFERKKAKNTVTSLSFNIIEHLTKIYIFENAVDKNHWMNELNNWLLEIDRIYLKPKNTKLSKQEIYNWILIDAAPHYSVEFLEKTSKRLSKQYPYKMHSIDYEWLLQKLFTIIDKVATDISNDMFENIGDYLI